MQNKGKIFLDVPRKIVHDKSDEMYYTDMGAEFAWIDMSKVLSLERYGFYFPNWLIKKNIEYCTLTIEKEYHSSYDERMHQNTFKVEHKVKVSGKRFKKFSYSPEELAELLFRHYSEKIEKIKSAMKNNKVLAKVKESSLSKPVAFYTVGYVNGKFFYSDEIQGGKRISAKSFQLIAEGLLDEDVQRIKSLIQAMNVAESELSELKQSIKLPFPFSYHPQQYEESEYIASLWYNGTFGKTKSHSTIKGYPDKVVQIQSSIQEAIRFLEDKILEIDDQILHFSQNES